MSCRFQVAYLWYVNPYLLSSYGGFSCLENGANWFFIDHHQKIFYIISLPLKSYLEPQFGVLWCGENLYPDTVIDIDLGPDATNPIQTCFWGTGLHSLLLQKLIVNIQLCIRFFVFWSRFWQCWHVIFYQHCLFCCTNCCNICRADKLPDPAGAWRSTLGYSRIRSTDVRASGR